jgi:hypothetical protein
MKLYHDIDEFIVETFPLEHQKIQQQQPSPIESEINNVDAAFTEKLKEILSVKTAEGTINNRRNII